MTTLEEGFKLLLTDPSGLMDVAYLKMAGGGPSSISGEAYFTFSKPETLQEIFKKDGEYVPGFAIEYHKKALDKTELGSGAGKLLPFSAQYVAMRKQAPQGMVPAGTLNVLPSTGGPDLCITSQLSGCTFGIGSQIAGGCCVCHIQPGGTANSTIQGQIADQADTLFAKKGRIVGTLVEKTNTYDHRANIIGMRDSSGFWRFWMQAFRGGVACIIDDPVALN